MPIPLWFVLELLDETSSIFHSYIIQSSSCNYIQAHTKKSFEAFFAIAMSAIKLSKYFLMKLYTESPEIRDQSRQMIYQILHCNRLFWILNWIGELFDWIILQFLEGKEELVLVLSGNNSEYIYCYVKESIGILLLSFWLVKKINSQKFFRNRLNRKWYHGTIQIFQFSFADFGLKFLENADLLSSDII